MRTPSFTNNGSLHKFVLPIALVKPIKLTMASPMPNAKIPLNCNRREGLFYESNDAKPIEYKTDAHPSSHTEPAHPVSR